MEVSIERCAAAPLTAARVATDQHRHVRVRSISLNDEMLIRRQTILHLCKQTPQLRS